MIDASIIPGLFIFGSLFFLLVHWIIYELKWGRDMRRRMQERRQGLPKPSFYERWHRAGGPDTNGTITFPDALAWLAEENAALKERIKKLEEKT